MKKNAAFTLIELLVVIAVIGILAGLIGFAAGSLKSTAREQHCRNNLRQLHDAVYSFGLEKDSLPKAQSYECAERGRRGVIGWVAPATKSGKTEPLVSFAPAKSRRETWSGEELLLDLGIGSYSKFAIENGTLFPYLNDMSVYACPVMKAEVRKRWTALKKDAADDQADNGSKDPVPVYRTYAMNAFFGSSDGDFLRDMNTWGANTLKIDRIGTHAISYTSYPMQKTSVANYKSHTPEPAHLLLFSEIVPDYSSSNPSVKLDIKQDNVSERSVGIRGGAASSDCCLNPEAFDSADERIGLDRNWGKGGKNAYSASEAGYQYGVHRMGVKRKVGGKSVEMMGSLAVFFDGHIEKVFANTDGETDGKNTAWYYNHGLTPSNRFPGSSAN